MKTHATFSILILFVLLKPFLSHAEALGQWTKSSVGDVEYHLYVPPLQSGKPRSLMINLHGCAQTPDDLKASGNWEAAADKYQMIVALPKVPRGGVIFGCWDYYGKNHSATGRHSGSLIALAEHLKSDPELAIDARRIYVSGLSSGGGQAFVLGCLRPDLFAGIGLSSSPVLGTGSGDLQRANTTADEAASVCRSLAGSRSASLATQVTSIIVGDQDHIVSPEHAVLSARAMGLVYGTKSKVPLTPEELTGAKTDGRGEIALDEQERPRVSIYVNTGLGHAWPAGNGSPPRRMTLPVSRFINGNSVDYPMYLGKFFSESTVRVDEPRSLR